MPTPPRIAIRRLAAARVISVTGSEAAWIALMVAIYADTHSTVWMSAALFAAIGASGLATPLIGTLGDRFDRRRVMVGSELAAAVVAGTTAAFTHSPVRARRARVGGGDRAVAVLLGIDRRGAQSGPAQRPGLGEQHRHDGAQRGRPPGADGGRCALRRRGPAAVFAASAVCFACSAAAVASVHGQFADPSGR